MKIEIKGYIHARSSTDSYGTPIVRHTFWPWEDCVDDSAKCGDHDALWFCGWFRLKQKGPRDLSQGPLLTKKL